MAWTRHSLAVYLSLFVGVVIKPAALADDERSMLDSWLIRTWQTDQGLPDNRVTGVVQAADGFIWVSTLGGLRRYDGADFEQYSIEHLPRVSNRLVRGMYLDRRDGLWLAMGRGGVIHVSGAAARVFDTEDGIEDVRVRFMTDDSEGNFWFVGGRLIHRIRGETVDRFGVEDGLPMSSSTGTCVASDREGRLWFAREEKVGLYREGRWEVLLTLDASPARLLGASGGGLWICLPSRVCRFSEEEGLREVVQLTKTMTVQVMLEDRDGALWIGTMADGLFRFQEGSIQPVAVSQPEINSLMQDREGNLWVGTQGGGLNMLHPRAVELIDAQSGLPMESVRSVCQDSEGWLWAAFQNGALARGRGRQWRAMTSADGWPGADVTCVTPAREGGVWIGTRDRGLHRLHAGQFQQWSTAEGLASQSVRSLLEASNGDLWVATDSPKQLKVFRNGVFHKANLPGAIQVVRALAEDAQGTIWAGTSDGQLLRMVGDTAVSQPEVEAQGSPSIRCLHATPDGSVWIGYAGEGVGRWRMGQYARVGSDQGLHDDYVAQIQSDDREGLWLIGNHGLFRVALENLIGVMEGRQQHIRSIVYGRSEGLPSIQPAIDNHPKTCLDGAGRLWFSTRNGLLVVCPGQIRDNPDPPPMQLKSVKLDDRLLAVDQAESPLRPATLRPSMALGTHHQSFEVPPRHSKIEFAFAALSFTSPENVHFRYRLKGFDSEWIEAGPARNARYPRLPSGRYEFHVTACNEAGVWNEPGVVQSFKVLPFFWQTVWFRALILVLFTAGVVATVRFVSFRHLRRQMLALEQQALLDKERARIAKDLHDDLGANMTQITLLLELASQHDAEPEAAHDRLGEGLRASREAIKSLDAAVWAINPANNTLPELVAYIGQFGMEFLQQAGIQCEVDLPDHPPEQPVSAELRHNLFLIVKEALNNVVQHAHATKVLLHISVTSAGLVLRIHDNGRGIEEPLAGSSGDGLRNMRQRAEELGAEFEIESKAGQGTAITIRHLWPGTQ